MRDVEALVAELRARAETRAATSKLFPPETFMEWQAADALESERSRADRLEKALTRTRASLQTELERGVITDTLWMNDVPSETIFDALDAALGKEDVSD